MTALIAIGQLLGLEPLRKGDPKGVWRSDQIAPATLKRETTYMPLTGKGFNFSPSASLWTQGGEGRLLQEPRKGKRSPRTCTSRHTLDFSFAF